jgi:tripartite-type tricarboxylate transporter receptor subunit TctC
MIKKMIAAAALSTSLTGFSAIAQTNSTMDFYAGKRIDFYISSTTGGGYDAMARVYARHLPRYIPGTPSVVVRNMPGAGGLVAANYL